MITIKENTSKKNNGKVVIGFDLGDNFSQISFLGLNDEEPTTISAVTGTQMYNIPTVLAKRPNVGQWFYGREALKYVNNGGILVDRLLSKAIRGEEVIVESESYDPIALLALFVKRALSLLNMQVSVKDIEAFMFTVDELNSRTVEVLSKLASMLSLKCEHVSFSSHVESLYYYMIHQDPMLWQYQVLVLEYNDILKTMLLESSKNTSPKVVFIHSEDYSTMQKIEWSTNESELSVQKESLDEQFLQIVENITLDKDITTVYLLGDGFKEEWATNSLKLLCKNRRVFQGNNLYSKGAAYGMLDKIHPSEVSKYNVYLGEDKLKSNIGIKALRRGEDSYFAILDAGINWFEAEADFEVLLEEGDEVPFVLTSLTGGFVTERRVKLEGLPVRPNRATFLHIHIEMVNVDTMQVDIEDLGFGEIIKSSGLAWSHTIAL